VQRCEPAADRILWNQRWSAQHACSTHHLPCNIRRKACSVQHATYTTTCTVQHAPCNMNGTNRQRRQPTKSGAPKPSCMPLCARVRTCVRVHTGANSRCMHTYEHIHEAMRASECLGCACAHKRTQAHQSHGDERVPPLSVQACRSYSGWLHVAMPHTCSDGLSRCSKVGSACRSVILEKSSTTESTLAASHLPDAIGPYTHTSKRTHARLHTCICTRPPLTHARARTHTGARTHARTHT
jgi:hypothetical protein